MSFKTDARVLRDGPVEDRNLHFSRAREAGAHPTSEDAAHPTSVDAGVGATSAAA